MPYALRFDGVNDVVTIPNGMSGNIGTSAYSFRVKSGPDGITLPATLNRGFIGASLASASGLVVTSGGLIEVWRVGTKLYGSAAQRLFTGVPFDFTLSHLADGTWTITDNLTSTVTDSGTYTNNITWSGSGVLNQIGKNSSNANNSCLAGDIALIAVTGLVNADTWDADLSGGSGSILPSVSGTNNGTLVNFSVPSCWVFYSSGLAPYLLSVIGALNKYVACNIPQPAIDTGRALQVEYEDEFEVRRTATDWPLASTSVSAANDLIFLRSGSDVEIRSTGNSNWTVTTGVDLTQFHVFRLRTTFDGTTITRQLYVDGALKGTTTSLSNARMGAMAAFFGLANDATRSGEFKYFKRTDFVNSANSREYNAGASGGIGNIIPELLYSLHGTQQGTWPSDNSEWVPIGAGGTSWAGTIGKTSLSSVTKALSINTGQSLDPNKVTLTLSSKQQSISTGFVATNGKTFLTLSPKQEAINVGYINTLSKLGLALLQKQLSITVGANLPFTGTIGKTTYALNGKQLGLALGWNSGVVKSTLPVDNKQENVLAGFVNTINEINIPVNGKPLNLQTGTSISYVGTINKGSLNASGKPLDVVAGTAIPFVGLMQKTSLTLTGKQLGVVRGQVLDLQKQALNIVGKQLSLGEIVYPIVPIERIFTIKDGDRIHYFKQTTTVYIMKNN